MIRSIKFQSVSNQGAMEYDPISKVFTKDDVKLVFNRNGLGCAFFEALKLHQSKLAQIDIDTGEREMYSEILEKSIKTAQKLMEVGLKPNDIVSFCSENNLDVIVPYIATLFVGGIIGCLDPSLSQEDCEHLLNDVRPKFVFISESSEQKITAALENTGNGARIVVFGRSVGNLQSFESFWKSASDVQGFEPCAKNEKDTAIIFFSSGTTGLPKGICANHSALIHQSNTYLGFANTKVTLSFATVYWISSALLIIKCILKGECRAICKEFNAIAVWKSIEKHRITCMLPSPILGIKLIETKVDCDVSSLENIPFGGSTMSMENLLKLKETFPKATVTFMYGQSEVGIMCYFDPRIREHVELSKKYPNSVGSPACGYSVKVVDPDTGHVLGPNQIGEMRVQTVHRMNGYHNRDCSDVYDEDGYIKTGDMCYYNEDLCFFVVDRVKEMFKYQGWHITPTKLESIMLQHPKVRSAVVIGIPHPRDENHAMAVCILKDGEMVSAEELKEFVNSKVEDRWMLRGGVKLVKELPYTPTGKIRRIELKRTILDEMNAI
ncbi:PREDICTED: luciferin 4-monooxygenase-like [Nicrophorus vespilloides]|uniref:Luciferin 4-monooxygenase-like n=1 Tax=Nicrophorus vespilloides TaxID=110193 RepID=A0ABM1MMI8_NICVS|nr:PREDICTED: luciferin 4-monooxygenase-like [Nicrophorus vespilloides]